MVFWIKNEEHRTQKGFSNLQKTNKKLENREKTQNRGFQTKFTRCVFINIKTSKGFIENGFQKQKMKNTQTKMGFQTQQNYIKQWENSQQGFQRGFQTKITICGFMNIKTSKGFTENGFLKKKMKKNEPPKWVFKIIENSEKTHNYLTVKEFPRRR